tara:strand:- start:3055 stop:4671 length:1617 start_codon:yes stop_codon:yes gene_type:complete
MKQYFIVAILLVFFISCSEEKEKSVGLPISSTNTDAISFFNKAQIHDQNFEFNEAKDDYRSAIEIDPNFILAHINLLRQGNSNTNWIDLSNKNIDIIESLISNGTEYEKTLFEMYKIPFKRNDSAVFNKRLRLGQKLINLYPNIDNPLIILAKQIPNYISTSLNKDWRNLRKESLLRALEINPNNIVASEELFYFKYGGTLNSLRFRSDKNFYDLFDSDAQELISRFPNSPRVLRRVGNIYRNSYDYIDVTRYEKSLKIFDKLIPILLSRESSFINDVLKSKADLLINIDRKDDCYNVMKLSIDSSKSLITKIESTFELFISYISGGDYLKAIKDINKFDQTLDEGLYDFNGEEISQKLWLKCKVSLNLYKALIYAHANQSERAEISLSEYKGYAKKIIQFNQIKTDEDFEKYYSENDLSASRVRWKTIHPQAISNYETWISVLIGDDKKTKDLINDLPDNSVWEGINTVIKGDFNKGLEILSNHDGFYSQYFRAQALIGEGKINDAKDILNNLRYIPYQNFDTSWTKNRAARLYDTL